MTETKDKKAHSVYLLLLILILITPVMQIAVALALNGKSIYDFIPDWIDELQWWCQADAVSRYGRPLGYWGWDGGTAQIGTFAFWGPAMVMPYGLFAFLFGWKWYSWIFANLFYTTIANMVFIRLTKINTKGLFWLFIANQLLFVKDYYLFTSMQETVRWSLGIVAIGLIVYLYRNRNMKWWTRYLLVPLYLIYITQAYLIWALFMLFYFLIVFDDLVGANKHDIYSIFYKIGGGIITFLVYVYLSRKLLYMLSSPFPHSAGSIKNNFFMMKEFIYHSGTPKFFFIWFFTSYIELMLYTSVFALFNAKRLDNQEKWIYIAAAITLLSFFAGHLVLYADVSTWTLVRGMCGGLVIAVFLLAIAKHRQGIVLFIVCAIAGFPTLSEINPVFFDNNRFVSERLKNNAAANANLWESMIGYAEEHTAANKDNPWDYTVATYRTEGTDFILTVLPGYSVNIMSNGAVSHNARYSVIGKVYNPDAANISMRLTDAGFIKVYEDNRIVGFVNPK